MVNHLSLFSGQGGFDLASQWMGWNNVAHCELNPFNLKILKYYWPSAISYEDITKSDFSIHRGHIDILTGGFPCQPYSSAGKRLGKEDDRHLWPEMLRAIREIQPRWVVGENVRGLTNWNGGLVFDEVQLDLETEGYEVTPFLLPACAVDAPHRRDRIWFVAHSESHGNRGRLSILESENGRIGQSEECRENYIEFGYNGSQRDVADSVDRRSQVRWTQGIESIPRFSREGDTDPDDLSKIEKSHSIPNWNSFPTKSPVCSGNDGLSRKLDGITFSKWRTESIKSAGNAIVPQLALQIFKAIQEYELLIQ